MRYINARVGMVPALVLALLAPFGCNREKQREKEREDKGRVNIEVQTPGGGTSVDVQYPKHKDHKDHDDHD